MNDTKHPFCEEDGFFEDEVGEECPICGKPLTMR